MSKSSEKSNSLLWSNINLIQESLGASEADLAKELGLNENKFIFHKKNSLNLPFQNIHLFSDRIGINTDAILMEELPRDQFLETIKLNWKSKLPSNYQEGTGSKSFTIRHILKIARKYGIYDDVCSAFELHGFSFETNIDFLVSVQLASDLLEFICNKVNVTDSDFSQLGLANSSYFENTAFGEKLKLAESVVDLYERFLDGVKNLEENWDYEIQYVDRNKIILNSYPTEFQSEAFRRRDYSSYTFTKFRTHVGAHLTRYIGLVGVDPVVTKSIHYGDSHCQINFDISNLRPLYA